MSDNRERNEHGQYRSKFTDEEILEAVRERDLPTTSEIAEAVGFAHQSSATHRLEQLQEAGKVASRKIGPSTVWMLTED